MKIGSILISLLLSGSIHLIAARWTLRLFPRLDRRLVIGLAVLFGILPSLSRALVVTAGGRFTVLLVAFSFLELFAVLFALLPTALSYHATKVVSPGETEAAVSRRVAVSRIVGTTAFGAATVTLGWGTTRGRHGFAIEEVVVKVKDWPRALDGYTIAQVSDIHVGAFTGVRELDEGFEMVRRAKPDLVVATGDLVDFESYDADILAAYLTKVGARDGAFAIAGNHDHYAGPADVARRLRAGGVRFLSNDGVMIRAADGGGFALLGVDDLQGRSRPHPGFSGPDLGRAISMVAPEAPRILLAHQPKFFTESRGRVSLQLSGHTHGGQINPGFEPARLFMRYLAGRYEEQGSTLWVNRGYGVVGPPARIAAPPEITRIVIVSV